METGIFILLGGIALALVLYYLTRSLLDQRRSLAVPSSEQDGGTGQPARPHASGVDFRWTGLFMAIVGTGAFLAGRGIGFGETAVGLYWGGWACMLTGAILFGLGFALSVIKR